MLDPKSKKKYGNNILKPKQLQFQILKMELSDCFKAAIARIRLSLNFLSSATHLLLFPDTHLDGFLSLVGRGNTSWVMAGLGKQGKEDSGRGL